MFKPHFTALAVTAIDGKIARYPGHLSDWASPEDKDALHAELDRSDVVVVGRATYELVKDRLDSRDCLVFTRSVKGLVRQGEHCLYCNADQVNLADVLVQYGYKRVAILGGTQVYSWFLKHNLIDELYLTIEPLVFGAGLPLFATEVADQHYDLVAVKPLNHRGTLLIHYRKSSYANT
ncbi:MAG: dihydrofolate reductase [Candidatus Kerfeldbacteria bacterium]|nr:dihydrofolate reductase [Candidatus Kerfeldbacteria bacterium]